MQVCFEGFQLVCLGQCYPSQALVEAGLAREIVNKFQKMRKSAGLTPGQVVECFVTYEGSAEEKASLQSVITAQAAYISESLGACPYLHDLCINGNKFEQFFNSQSSLNHLCARVCCEKPCQGMVSSFIATECALM